MPWWRAGSGFSLVMKAFVIALCQAIPVAHVARLVGVPDDRRLLFATHCRDAQTFALFAADLSYHRGDRTAITDISMDMSQGFQSGAKRLCPQAHISFDPFHVVVLASRALDQVRRAETWLAPELKDIRWALLKNAERWNPE